MENKVAISWTMFVFIQCDTQFCLMPFISIGHDPCCVFQAEDSWFVKRELVILLSDHALNLLRKKSSFIGEFYWRADCQVVDQIIIVLSFFLFLFLLFPFFFFLLVCILFLLLLYFYIHILAYYATINILLLIIISYCRLLSLLLLLLGFALNTFTRGVN